MDDKIVTAARIVELWAKIKSRFVQTVNGTAPDASGNVDLGDIGGYTPVRGTDYWTDEDIAQIKAYVDDAILNGEW